MDDARKENRKAKIFKARTKVMSKLAIAAKGKKSAVPRSLNVPFSAETGEPGTALTIEIGSSKKIKDRLSTLGLPENIISLILDTTYIIETSLGRQIIPLFSMSMSISEENVWVYNMQEIVEIVRVYDLMLGVDTAVGTPEDPVRPDDSTLKIDRPVSLEEAYDQFRAHISALASGREAKTRNDLVIDDDSVYEAPALEPLRREELLRIDLMNRRRIPVKGRCAKDTCKGREVYRSEAYSRSWDEASVWHYECAQCHHTWRA